MERTTAGADLHGEPHPSALAHLPAATGRVAQFLDLLASVPDAPPFSAPDATAFGHIAAALNAASPTSI